MPKKTVTAAKGGNVLAIMGALLLGAILAGIIVPAIGGQWGISGWVSGFITAIIQMLIVVVAIGTLGKLGIVEILLGAVVIFVGGIVGGWLSGYLTLTTQVQTLLIVLVQSALLLAMGFTGKGKAAVKIPK